MKATIFAAVLACATAVAAGPIRQRNQEVWFDDQGSRIAYPPTDSGNFVHETNQDQSIYYKGTFSYSNDANAGYDFYLDDNASSFTIMSGKKNDRGTFRVYTLDHSGTTVFIGSGDQYDANAGGLGTPSQPLFYYQLSAGGPRSFRVENVANDGRISGNAYLGIDYIIETVN